MNIANEIEKQSKRKTYSKIAYNRNAIAIFIITSDFADEEEFLNFKKIDVSTFKAMYQLMSDFKKKVFYKTIMQILTFDTSDFIDQNFDYFLTWLNRFREGSHLTLKKKNSSQNYFHQEKFRKTNFVTKKLKIDFREKSKNVNDQYEKIDFQLKNSWFHCMKIFSKDEQTKKQFKI